MKQSNAAHRSNESAEKGMKKKNANILEIRVSSTVAVIAVVVASTSPQKHIVAICSTKLQETASLTLFLLHKHARAHTHRLGMGKHMRLQCPLETC